MYQLGLKMTIKNRTAYTINELTPNQVLIIFHTWERPDSFFNEITRDLKSHTTNADIYFDLLVNNGLKDRFYVATFNNGELKLNSFKKVKPSDEYVKISDDYFSRNWDIVESNSVLTKFQKSFYKSKLKA